MDDIEKDAYIIELEKCKLIRLCIIDKIHKKFSQIPLFEEKLLILQSKILKRNNSYDFKVPAVGNKDAYGAVYVTMAPNF
jgi:hypothetical protein